MTGGAATLEREAHPAFLCCIESTDGRNWQRLTVGRHEFGGSRDNNIVLAPEEVAGVKGDPAHTAVWRDENPACPPDARYKILMLGKEPTGLYLLGSEDGLAFRLLSPEPVITTGAFDSQNLMFWDPVRQEYREYHRGFNEGCRDILTAVSPDCLHFPEPEWLRYPGSAREQLYTNQVLPYPRAPHLLTGFPARYVERAWDLPLYALPGLPERLSRGHSASRYGGAVTDTVFMSSRDGLHFNRWAEAFIRPGPRRRGSWVYGDNYTVWGMLEAPSDTEDAPDELSFFASEDYWEGVAMSLRRYSLRLDGFVSLQAGARGGEIVTCPFRFEGGNLVLNLETSAPGSVQVELQDAAGRPLPGRSVSDCPPIFGDSVEHIVRWREGGDLRACAGQAVRLRLVLRDADVYSFRFVPYAPDPELPDLTGIVADG